MSAQDNLNSQQFPRMPLEHLKSLPAVDTYPYGWHPMESVLGGKKRDLADEEGTHGWIKDDMAAHGQLAPVHVFKATPQSMADYGITEPDERYMKNIWGKQVVGNGGHRIAAADELGWKDLATTDDYNTAEYGPER